MKKLMFLSAMLLCTLALTSLKAQEPSWNRMCVYFDGYSSLTITGEFLDPNSQILLGSGAGIVAGGTSVWSYLAPPIQTQIPIYVNTTISNYATTTINGAQYLYMQFVYEATFGVVFHDEYMPIGTSSVIYF